MQILETHQLQMVSSNDMAETVSHTAHFLSGSSLTQLGSRHCPARIGGLQFGGLSFALVEFGASMQVEAPIEDDYYVIMACLRGTADMVVDGRTVSLQAGKGFLARPCQSIIGRCSEDCSRLMVRIEPDMLKTRRYADFDERFSPLDPQMRPWFEQVQCLLSSPALMHRVANDPEVSAQMESLLFALLRSNGILEAKEAQKKGVVSRDVRRADIFIRSHAQDTICLDDIVGAAGVSARALQNNFMRFYQTSPMQHLRDVRLNMVHERLLASDGSLLVSDVALESGFNHLGRFSIFYREKYGESPSATMRRASRYSKASRGSRHARTGESVQRRALSFAS